MPPPGAGTTVDGTAAERPALVRVGLGPAVEVDGAADGTAEPPVGPADNAAVGGAGCRELPHPVSSATSMSTATGRP